MKKQCHTGWGLGSRGKVSLAAHNSPQLQASGHACAHASAWRWPGELKCYEAGLGVVSPTMACSGNVSLGWSEAGVGAMNVGWKDICLLSVQWMQRAVLS